MTDEKGWADRVAARASRGTGYVAPEARRARYAVLAVFFVSGAVFGEAPVNDACDHVWSPIVFPAAASSAMICDPLTAAVPLP